MTEVQEKPKRSRKPAGKSADDPATYVASEPQPAPVFRRGDRVDYWFSSIDGNLEADVADVLKVFSGLNGQPTRYWVNVHYPGGLRDMTVEASNVPAHNKISPRE